MAEISVIWNNNYADDCIPNFSDNMGKVRHRWYEFKEGFSASLVERAIRETRTTENADGFTVLDPFSGSGTSTLTALENECDAIGFEVNPFMSFVGQTKCVSKGKKKTEYLEELRQILSAAPYRKKSQLEGVSTFSPKPGADSWLFNIDVLRTFEALYSHICTLNDIADADIFKLALISSMMQCCNARKDGKCLRYLTNWKELNFSGKELRHLFRDASLRMIEDIEYEPLLLGTRKIQEGDTRELIKKLPDKAVDLIIFSPPYLNSFDYSDIYRPELFLCGYVKNNYELMEIRKKTLRSHVQCKWETLTESDSILVKDIVRRLHTKKESLWNANIPQMVSAYFYDMRIVLEESYRVARNNGKLWFVVSTSAYGGIEIPVDLILANIAVELGWTLEGVYALRQLRTSSQCVDENNSKVKLRESLVICRK